MRWGVPGRALTVIEILAVVAFVAGPAGADPAPSEPPAPAPVSFGPPSQLEPPSAVPPAPARSRTLSEGTAFGLSFGGSLVSWALLYLGVMQDSSPGVQVGLLGTFLAPSAGHWYAGTALTRGMGIRAVGAAVFTFSILTLIGCDGCDGEEQALGLYGGLLLYAGGTIDDIATAPGRARRRNQRVESLGLAPVVTRHSAGLALGGRF